MNMKLKCSTADVGGLWSAYKIRFMVDGVTGGGCY